jgi:quinol monooxygenase YgiN
MTRRVLTRIGIWAAAACLPGAALFPLSGQERNIRTLTRYQVKAERYDDFVDLLQHFAEQNRKAGTAAGFTVWQSLSGPREFVITRNYATWADLNALQDPKLHPNSAEWGRAMIRVGGTVESQERIIDQVQTFSFSNRSEPPKMLRSVRSTVRPDKVNEYLALLRNELAPALKKSGAPMYIVGRTRLGAPNNLIRSATAIDKWGDMDDASYLVKALGEDGAARFLEKVSAMSLRTEVNLYRYRADLSCLPAPAGGPTSGR